MGKHYPKIQCSMTIAALTIFGAKIKIALTGVHSSVIAIGNPLHNT